MSGKKCAALLILLGLLTGCGEQSDPGIPVEAPNSSSQQDSERTQLEVSDPAQSAAEPGIHGLDSAEDSIDSTAENQIESGTADTDALEEEAAVLGDFSERPESISLYEDEKISVVLLPVRDIEDGSSELFIQVDSHYPETVGLYVSDITLDRIELNGSFWEDVEPNKRKQAYLLGFGARLNEISLESEITCKLKVNEGGKFGTTVLEQDLRFPIPKEFYDGCLDFLGAGAEEQVLMDNERGRITLLECGSYPQYTEQSFDAMLFIENTTKQTRRFDVAKVRINGKLIDADFSELRCDLPPETDKYYKVEVWHDSLAEAGITSIHSLELLIVDGCTIEYTDGMHKDGTWYPITLSSTGEQQENQQDIDGTVLMSADGITVYYLQNEVAKWRRDHWEVRICVENDSNQDVCVTFDGGKYLCGSIEVGTQSTATGTITFGFPLGQPVTASATVYTLSRDKLLIPAQEFTIPGL